MTGRTAEGAMATVRHRRRGSAAANPAFDVTPARLVTGLITERGRCAASEAGLLVAVPGAPLSRLAALLAALALAGCAHPAPD